MHVFMSGVVKHSALLKFRLFSEQNENSFCRNVKTEYIKLYIFLHCDAVRIVNSFAGQTLCRKVGEYLCKNYRLRRSRILSVCFHPNCGIFSAFRCRIRPHELWHWQLGKTVVHRAKVACSYVCRVIEALRPCRWCRWMTNTTWCQSTAVWRCTAASKWPCTNWTGRNFISRATISSNLSTSVAVSTVFAT